MDVLPEAWSPVSMCVVVLMVFFYVYYAILFKDCFLKANTTGDSSIINRSNSFIFALILRQFNWIISYTISKCFQAFRMWCWVLWFNFPQFWVWRFWLFLCSGICTSISNSLTNQFCIGIWSMWVSDFWLAGSVFFGGGYKFFLGGGYTFFLNGIWWAVLRSLWPLLCRACFWRFCI